MGASNSRPEEDMSLQVCHDRKKFIKKAFDCRCVLAEAHVTYIQSLKSTGRVLLEFFAPQGLVESDLHDSTDANNDPVVPNEKCPNGSSCSRKNEEIAVSPAAESETVPNEKHESVSAPSPPSAETSPWDYFDLSHPVDDQPFARKVNGSNEGLESGGETGTALDAEDEGNANEVNVNIHESEDEDEINFILEQNDSNESGKDCDEPLSEGIVDSVENINMESDILGVPSSPSLSVASASTEISEIFLMGRSRSPDLSPLREIAPSVSTTVNLTRLNDIEEETNIQENIVESKANANDLYSKMKDIEQLFIEASESGKEVLRMLEANKLHFRRVPPKQKGESKKSWCLIACFSHQKEPYQVADESSQASKRYLTSQRHMSAHSFTSIASQNPRDDLANSSNGIYCMSSGSHVSTLDRLYAWENKLYDEVKASQIVRSQFDLKCKLLRHQEDKGESAKRIDKTRAVIKDLHSRIRVSIKRMETISRKIIRIRDFELQPQFEELIQGSGNMWQKMHESHKRQFDIISAALSLPTEIAINSENRQLINYHLEQQLRLISLSYTRLVTAYQSYLKGIEGWLLKCILFPEKSSKKTGRHQPIPISKYSPPIFVTCRSWLEGLETLAAETSRLGNTVSPVDESDNFCRGPLNFFSQLKTFSESSANVYKELEKSIQEASSNYEQFMKSQPS